jgi:type VI secretion system protein ImpE
MNTSELFKAGLLQTALTEQLGVVKNNPADAGARTCVFELLAFVGDIDRARRQLDVLKTGETEHDLGVTLYEQLLDAEQLRRQLFSKCLQPEFLTPPPDHVQHRLRAVQCLSENNPQEAAVYLARAVEEAPAIQGKLNGRPFTELRDCDDLFGDVLEMMFQGKYYWLPLEQVSRLVMGEPRYPRDLLWVPAQLILTTDQVGEVFFPALYPGSWQHQDDEIRLGRKSDWQEHPDGPVLGMGQHTFLVDDDAMGILEWRELVIEEVESEQ